MGWLNELFANLWDDFIANFLQIYHAFLELYHFLNLVKGLIAITTKSWSGEHICLEWLSASIGFTLIVIDLIEDRIFSRFGNVTVVHTISGITKFFFEKRQAALWKKLGRYFLWWCRRCCINATRTFDAFYLFDALWLFQILPFDQIVNGWSIFCDFVNVEIKVLIWLHFYYW